MNCQTTFFMIAAQMLSPPAQVSQLNDHQYSDGQFRVCDTVVDGPNVYVTPKSPLPTPHPRSKKKARELPRGSWTRSSHAFGRMT